MSHPHSQRPQSASSLASPRPPRFEFSSTMIRRPNHAVSMNLRTQPVTYPHAPQTDSAAAVDASGGVATTVRRRSSRDGFMTPPTMTTRRNVHSHHAAIQPIRDEQVFVDRYLPQPQQQRPYSAMTTQVGYEQSSHDPDTQHHFRTNSLPSSSPSLALTSYHQPFTNHVMSNRIRQKEAAAAIGTRGFMSSPVYQQWHARRERMEREEQEGIPTSIPYPAKHSAAIGVAAHHNSSVTSTPSTTTPSSISTIRLSSALGLHERSLDTFQILRELKADLERNWEMVEMEEEVVRMKEEEERQKRVREERQMQQQQQQQLQQQQYQQSSLWPSHITNTTLALLNAQPAGSMSSRQQHTQNAGLLLTAPPVTQSSTSALHHNTSSSPTFLTDSEVTSHALSNFTPAERKKLFGGAYAERTKEEEEEKENESYYGSSSVRAKSIHRHRQPPPISVHDLPAQVVYTEQMCTGFEESLKYWIQYLIEKEEERKERGEKQSENGSEIDNTDLILLLHDLNHKYSTLIRMAMTPHQPQYEILLPRMMEAVWKVVMVVMEVALVRKGAAAAAAATATTMPGKRECMGGEGKEKTATTATEKQQTHPSGVTANTPTGSSNTDTGVEQPSSDKSTTSQALTVHHGASPTTAAPPLPSSFTSINSPLLVAGATTNNIDTNLTTSVTKPNLFSTTLLPLSDSAFNPSNPLHLTLFQTALKQYELEMKKVVEKEEREEEERRRQQASGGDSTALVESSSSSAHTTSTSVTHDILSSLSLHAFESSLRDTGYYSVGLILQRDSLMKSNERLMRENEYLKLSLKESYTRINYLQESQEIRLRNLAQEGEDTVGHALDELDEFMADMIDSREQQYSSIHQLTGLTNDWLTHHASAVSSGVNAERSYKESVETIERVQKKEKDIIRQREAEVKHKEETEHLALLEKQKAFSILPSEISSLTQLTDEEILLKIQTISDVDTLRGMIHKLLYTKIKKAVHETPAQAQARRRKERTPGLLKQVIFQTMERSGGTSGSPNKRVLSIKNCVRWIMEVYLGKVASDEGESREMKALNVMSGSGGVQSEYHSILMPYRKGNASTHHHLSTFLHTHFLRHFGLKHIGENNLTELLRSILIHLNHERSSYQNKYGATVYVNNADLLFDRSCFIRMSLFQRLLSFYTNSPLPNESCEFLVFLVRCVVEACIQTLSPSAVGIIQNAASVSAGTGGAAGGSGGGGGGSSTANGSILTTTILDPKSMLRVLELSSINIQSKRKSKKKQSRELHLQRTKNDSSSSSDSDNTEHSISSYYLPHFLFLESISHSFRHLGFTDETLDTTLCMLESQLIWAGMKVSQVEMTTQMKEGESIMLAQKETKEMVEREEVQDAGTTAATSTVESLSSSSPPSTITPTSPPSLSSDPTRLRFLFKHLLVRQIIRSSGMGTSLLAFDKFDQPEKTGIVTFTKLKALIEMDKETANVLQWMMDPTSGLLSPHGGLTQSDFLSCLNPENKLCLSFDMVLEVSTLMWKREYDQITKKYEGVCEEVRVGGGSAKNMNVTTTVSAVSSTTSTATSTSSTLPPSTAATTSSILTPPKKQVLLTFPEFCGVISTLDNTRTRTSMMKWFRDGKELEKWMWKDGENKNEEKEVEKEEKEKTGSKKSKSKKKDSSSGDSTGSNKKKSKSKKKSSVIPPPPPLTGIGAKPLESKTIVEAGQEEESAASETDKSTSSASTSATSSPARRVRRKSTDGTDSKSAATSLASTVPAIRDNDFLRLETVLTILRKHRIGLTQRKSYNELKSFARRYKSQFVVQQTVKVQKEEEVKFKITLPMLDSELAGMTSIPE